MADNVDVTPGSGKTIAGDDISGVIHQRVKMEFGGDGSATEVSLASPLPTQIIGGTLVSEKYDNITAAYPTSTTETYTYKLGATTIALLTVTYSDPTKSVLSSVVRS